MGARHPFLPLSHNLTILKFSSKRVEVMLLFEQSLWCYCHKGGGEEGVGGLLEMVKWWVVADLIVLAL
jgi:hypothetical protein